LHRLLTEEPGMLTVSEGPLFYQIIKKEELIDPQDKSHFSFLAYHVGYIYDRRTTGLMCVEDCEEYCDFAQVYGGNSRILKMSGP
jgi:hypothetical protein